MKENNKLNFFKGQLHWRRYNMAVSMICLLPRNDHPLSARAVQLTVKNLNHENIFVRKAAIHLTSTILSQQKRRHPKMTIPSPREGIPGNYFVEKVKKFLYSEYYTY